MEVDDKTQELCSLFDDGSLRVKEMADRVINFATASLENYFKELGYMHDGFDEQYKYHAAHCEKEESC